MVAATGSSASSSVAALLQEARPEELTLLQVRELLRSFARERDWDQHHTPRNLLLALVGEVGELAEIFQWKKEVPPGLPGWSEADLERVRDEVSDCLCYLVRFADRCGLDLGSAVLGKLGKNAAKYPKELVKGSAAKYTAYAAAVEATKTAATAAAGASPSEEASSDAKRPCCTTSAGLASKAMLAAAVAVPVVTAGALLLWRMGRRRC
eukprot:TRINITY_DN14175_c0_g1_i1.p2 TRINITY_DN14175_c0_g1~~TRINITY_DN14175_c0_g1_i1.p2  ORF type:complete len:244 (-),score=55.90 TRINITY_DN14175_c0_g1_i1:82-708(-)